MVWKSVLIPLWVKLLIVAILIAGRAEVATDPRGNPITPEELKQSIRLPLSLKEQAMNLHRSCSSHLQLYAYQLYKKFYEAHPHDINAQILCGLAAEDYRNFVLDPGPQGSKQYNPDDLEALKETQQTILKCFEQAIRKDKTGFSQSLLGGYLYAYNLDQARGMNLLRLGIKLSPKSAGLHANLGGALSLLMHDFKNLKEAERELKLAIQLDQLYAQPHYDLAVMYINQGRRQDCITELKAYVALLRPGVAAKNYMILFFCRDLNIKLETLTGEVTTS